MKELGRALLILAVSTSMALALFHWLRPPSDGARDQVATNTAARPGADNAKGTAQWAPDGHFQVLDRPRPTPNVTFRARDGSPLRLSDFHGRWILVNFWATWCVPCVREMPSLDRLQAKLGDRMNVIAISEDRGAANVVEPFLRKAHLRMLATYLDPDATAGHILNIRGVPTSFIIDPNGDVIAQVEGATLWDSTEMQARLEQYMLQSYAAGSLFGAATGH